MLRRGNHPSAKFWRRVLLPVIERYRDRDADTKVNDLLGCRFKANPTVWNKMYASR